MATTKRIASILNIPVIATTQNAARLGDTVSEVSNLFSEQKTPVSVIDKTAFSMLVPEVTPLLSKGVESSAKHSVIITGIETHICVTQTTIDLLRQGHKVYLLADGVSSCNELERPIALARLAREGAVVTTSESILFELLGDAKHPDFRAISGLVKDTKEKTKGAVASLGKL
ncbi:hypothetical protein LTR84_002376 [Exophiala bonariae]|uniref:Isochorismatase-like domain-containing protein n=1 Tax=Exophiala bonariae TaxID=1690606 RepID=A0AAV9N9M7_9EURO|nr:hypothetical protein LTR84_002376 [Exophiala bonariae]